MRLTDLLTFLVLRAFLALLAPLALLSLPALFVLHALLVLLVLLVLFVLIDYITKHFLDTLSQLGVNLCKRGSVINLNHRLTGYRMH